MLAKCQICSSYFGDIKCVYCQRVVCSSCISDNKIKCKKCGAQKKPPSNFLKSNIRYILLFVALWFFVSGLYPFPYLLAIGVPLDFRIMQPVLIATGIMMIPFVFMMFAWKKRPPSGWTFLFDLIQPIGLELGRKALESTFCSPLGFGDFAFCSNSDSSPLE